MVEQGIGREIVLRPQPSGFQLLPKPFGDVKMGRVGWQIENIQAPFLPGIQASFDFLCCMYRGIIKHHYRLFLNIHGKAVQFFDNKICVNALFCHTVNKFVVSGKQGKTVDTSPFCRLYKNIFPFKLPAIRNVPLFTDPTLVTIKQINMALFALLLQEQERPFFKLVQILATLAFRPSSYPFVAAVMLFKKRFSVFRLKFFSSSFSSIALAWPRRCRSCFTVSNTLAASAPLPKIGFLPRPGLV